MTHSKKKNKSQVDFIIAIVVIVALIGAGVLIKANSMYQTIQTLRFTEDVSQLNTHLFVLMNNNQCGAATTLPFKTIVAQALAQDETNIGDGDTDFIINYNGVTEANINIKACVEDYFTSLAIDDYYFYTTYKGVNKTKIGEEIEYMIEEKEYFSIPDSDNTVATATLMVKLTQEIDYDNPPCSGNGIEDCYPRMTCIKYGGTCNDNHVCSKLKCCCENVPLW